jgi:hypothetical protein
MELDLRTTDQRKYDEITRGGERHQLHWTIEDGTITPRLTCLHGTLPAGRYCAAQTLAEHPELLMEGLSGSSDEARDGIIVSRWRHAPCRWSCPEDDGPEFLWHYEDEDLHRTVPTQRHTLRFIFGEERVEPVFECLHAESSDCHATFWRDDLWLFPEWHAGPDTALHAGAIVSWWSTREPTTEELPYWAYEEHAAGALITTLSTTKK